MLTWAERHFTYLDGTLQLRGIDLYERAKGPLDRFISLLYALVLENAQWAKEEDRKALHDMLEWPAITEVEALRESDESARRNLAALGIDLPMLG